MQFTEDYNKFNLENLDFDLFDQDMDVNISKIIQRHPNSAFQPISSFHKRRNFAFIDQSLASRNESTDNVFKNVPVFFQEDDKKMASDSLVKLNLFPAK